VYRMAYDRLVSFHMKRGADLTIAVTEVLPDDASRYGIVSLDETDRVVDFLEKPQRPPASLASMGVYVFSQAVLLARLEENVRRRSSYDFGKDVIPAMVQRDRVYGYRFDGYWRDVGTVHSYWQANVALLEDEPDFNLYDREMVIHTTDAQRPPARMNSNASVSTSLVSNGCVIKGEVRHSVLSPGVVVEDGALVQDSVICDDVRVGRDARICFSIVDKEAQIGAGAAIGWGDDYAPNREEPDNLAVGISLVGRRARVPAGVKVGRNCRIDPRVTEDDFQTDEVPSGGIIYASRAGRGSGGGPKRVRLPVP
jgi:glucose-1-phosphate adenylyltransferase